MGVDATRGTRPSDLAIHFGGWIQIRLATDPDPADEPRGVSGWTFAVAGEPDLDRVVRLQAPPPGTHRSHAPPVGVTVCRVAVDGVVDGRHPLLHRAVDLVDEPKLEGRNGVLAIEGCEVIDPFHLVVGDDALRLAKRDRFMRPGVTDDSGEYESIHLVPPEIRMRRQPIGRSPAEAVKRATGIYDVHAFRARRVSLLETELEAAAVAGDAVAVVAIGKRLRELRSECPRLGLLYTLQSFSFDIDGPGMLHDPRAVFAGRVDTNAPWRVRFWIGGWDTDALQAYMRGCVLVPLTPRG